jgi:hypothetical protein
MTDLMTAPETGFTISEAEAADLFIALTGDSHLAGLIKARGLTTIPALVEKLRDALGLLA